MRTVMGLDELRLGPTGLEIPRIPQFARGSVRCDNEVSR
jgi:hypothetical protein